MEIVLGIYLALLGLCLIALMAALVVMLWRAALED